MSSDNAGSQAHQATLSQHGLSGQIDKLSNQGFSASAGVRIYEQNNFAVGIEGSLEQRFPGNAGYSPFSTQGAGCIEFNFKF
jgi:hypothetical protein